MCLSVCVFVCMVCVRLFSIILFYKEASAHEWSWKLHSKCLACDCVWLIFIFFSNIRIKIFQFSFFDGRWRLWVTFWWPKSWVTVPPKKLLGEKKRFRILGLLLTFCPPLSCVHELNWKLICYYANLILLYHEMFTLYFLRFLKNLR